MEKAAGRNKTQRVLSLYNRLMEGCTIDKDEEAARFHVDTRSIQRDVDDVRAYLADAAADGNVRNDVIYDRREKGYRLEQIERLKLSNGEVLAICKILLDSRAFTKREMLAALRKLIGCSVPKKNQKLITDLIRNEAFHYVEPRHRTVFIDKLWSIAQAIRGKRYIEIEYRRLKDRSLVRRKLRPAAVMFSEYYFYVAAFIDDRETRRTFDAPGDPFPTIYRADRIAGLKVLDETFSAPYKRPLRRGRVPQADPVHVRRRAPKSRLHLQGTERRSRPRPPADGQNPRRRKRRLHHFRRSLRQRHRLLAAQPGGGCNRTK